MCYTETMENSLKARIRDLDRTAAARDVTKHSMFLSPTEQSEVLGMERELTCPGYFFTGGSEEAERRMIVFPSSYDDPERLEAELLACIRVEPAAAKFSDDLTHRDYLGALMNLGIDRGCLGDIRMDGNAACIFMVREMVRTVADGLDRVKHTTVRTKEIPLSCGAGSVNFREQKVNVASERLDGIIAAVFRLSRSEASALIAAEKVFLDGRTAAGGSSRLTEGMKISVRGMGKFIYDGIEAESRKGRLFVKIRRYV